MYNIFSSVIIHINIITVRKRILSMQIQSKSYYISQLPPNEIEAQNGQIVFFII